MATLPNPKTVTYEEWLQLPEVQDAKEEVVNGEIRIMPPAKWKHALIVRSISRALESRLDAGRILVMTTQFGLIIRKHPLTSRVPDIAVFRAETLVEQDGYIHSAPQLLVEVLSPGNTRREREEKLNDYASLGVPEVWIVDPEHKAMDVFVLESGALRLTETPGGVLGPRQFPEAEVEIASIWPA